MKRNLINIGKKRRQKRIIQLMKEYANVCPGFIGWLSCFFFFQSLIHFDFIKYILLYIICSIFVVVLLNIMLSAGKDNVMFGAEKRWTGKTSLLLKTKAHFKANSDSAEEEIVSTHWWRSSTEFVVVSNLLLFPFRLTTLT